MLFDHAILPSMQENEYILKLKAAVFKWLQDEPVKIVLFGSRARENFSGSSDVDIGIIPYGEYDRAKPVRLREQIEELNIPFHVDLVDLNETSEDFKNEALKGAIIWKS